RNLALFQQTSESSTYKPDRYNAKFAVDGRIIPSCLLGGCSHTHTSDTNPTWTVYFDQRVQINKFVLYNRIDDKQERLKGFLLEMLDNNNLTIYSYQNNSEPMRLVYTVLNLKAGAGAAVRISQKNIIGSDSVPFVTLNEFEAFGECLPGFWGLNCRNVCESVCSSSCEAEHGKCNTVCKLVTRIHHSVQLNVKLHNGDRIV
ncbi:multiple epidermal growth factor-like domains protein 11, partial [Biomphalaria glabrata]